MAASIPKEQIERAARVYRTNRLASNALGIHLATFSRLCREYGVVTPFERRRQQSRTMRRSLERSSKPHPFVRRIRTASSSDVFEVEA